MKTITKERSAKREMAAMPVSQPTRVLVVDDEPLIISLVCTILQKLNFQVDFARDGREAILCFQGAAYDLVLTDLEMPFINGFELACWIKDNWSGTKVAIMTSSHSIDGYVNEKPNPVDRWIFKPLGFGMLKEVMSEFFPPKRDAQLVNLPVLLTQERVSR